MLTRAASLDGPQRPPENGKARQLVVFLHGLGADGNDLIGLAPLLREALPEAHFAAPNAPYPCDMSPYGYQWFSLLERSPEALYAGVEQVRETLNRYLDGLLASLGLPPSKLAIVGFSQGTMTALHAMLRRPQPCAAVVGFSGMLVAGAGLKDEVRSKPPVCLIHGDADMVVPPAMLTDAAAALLKSGVPVEAHSRPGLAHAIDPEGLDIAAQFLKRHLGYSA